MCVRQVGVDLLSHYEHRRQMGNVVQREQFEGGQHIVSGNDTFTLTLAGEKGI